MVFNTSITIGDQIVWSFIGIILLIIVSRIDYHIWYAFAVPFILASLFLLAAVFVPTIGVRVLGASRWINFGLFVLQPSELAKLALTVYLAAWFTSKEKDRFQTFLKFMAIIIGLVTLQPDLGTSIILFTIAFCVYFASGSSMKQFLRITPILLVILAIVVVVAPYRFARIKTFLHPESDPLGASYQIRQARLAIGSGEWLGVGLGKSRQKYDYLPEANTDAIFAIVAEELGFVGAFLFLLLFLFIVSRGYKIARNAPDAFGQLLATGITSWFGFQSIINISAIVGLMPLTGVPLPLVSEGGSSTIIILIAFGILLNISRKANI